MPLTSMKLVEITDRNLLAVLVDVSDHDGMATAQDISAKLGIKAHDAVACVRQRLVWLKRYGMLENHFTKGEDTRWGLTDKGRDLYSGRLRSAAEKALSGLDAGGIWAAASLVTQSYDTLDDSTASMVRRDFQHHQQRRRRITGR